MSERTFIRRFSYYHRNDAGGLDYATTARRAKELLERSSLTIDQSLRVLDWEPQ